MRRSACLAALLAVFATNLHASAPHRSAAAVAAFKRTNPCPVNGATRGSCPGYQVDHIQPLCAGGPDEPANMQWLTIHDHAHKTKLDVMLCRSRGPFKPIPPEESP